MGLTTAKRQDHSGIVSSLQGVIADLKEVIKEKEMREEGKESFEEDLQDHMDAIQALNEAIEILANFYAKRGKNMPGLIQEMQKGAKVAQKHGKVGAFLQKQFTGFLEPDGAKTVGIMSDVRKEFESAKSHLEKEEATAVAEFEQVKNNHKRVDADLNSDRNTLTVEEQTAESSLESAEHDKESNEGEVAAADDYLQQLGKSCYPLIMHFDERTKLRKEEKTAIEDAIKVLRKA